MSFYSARFVILVSFLKRKLLGAIALYRLRSLVPGVGLKSRCGISTQIKYAENLKIGNNVGIGPDCTLGAYAGIVLEDYVRISKGVLIETAGLDLSSSLPYKHKGRPIVIKKGAWLGAGSMILGGVTVGENAIIGAGCIVTKDVEKNAIVVSQPFRVIGENVNK